MLDKGDDHLMLKPLAHFFDQQNGVELSDQEETEDLLAALKKLVGNKNQSHYPPMKSLTKQFLSILKGDLLQAPIGSVSKFFRLKQLPIVMEESVDSI